MERIAPQLIPVDVLDGDGKVKIIDRASGKTLILKASAKPLIEHFLKGGDVADYILIQNQHHQPVSFKAMSKVLDALYFGGFLQNEKSFVGTLDSLRDEFALERPSIKTAGIKWILKGVHSKTNPWVPGILWPFLLVILISSFEGLLRFTKLVINDGSLLWGNAYWNSLLTLVAMSSVLLSLKSLVKFVLMGVFLGRWSAVNLRLDLLGLYLETTYKEKCPQLVFQIQYFLIVLVSLSVFGLVDDLAPLFGMNRQQVLELRPLLWFVVLFELTPFAHSETINLMGTLFNLSFEDINTQLARTWHKYRDQGIYYLHFILNVAWLVLFASLMTMLSTTVFYDLVVVLSAGSWLEMISAVALLWYLLQIVWTSLSDILSCFKYSGPAKSFRKFWLQHTQELKESTIKEASENNDAMTILRSVPPFNLMPHQLLANVVKKTSYQGYKPHSFLCREGDADRDLFLIVSGRVGVFKRSKMGKYHKIAELGEGSVFGEVGFFTGALRTADIRALTKVKVFRVHHDPSYQDFSLQDDKFKFLQDRLWLSQALQNSALFRDLPVEAHNLIIGAGLIKTYAVDHVVIQEGSADGGFYILVEGTAEVSQSGQVIRKLKRGDVFGEIGLLFNVPRTASVVAKSEIKVLELQRQEFWSILSEQFVLGCHLEAVAQQRLKNDNVRDRKPS